jgi:hypothetical protein
LVSLEEMTIDGTKLRVGVGRRSLAQHKRLQGIDVVVATRIMQLTASWNWVRCAVSPARRFLPASRNSFDQR